MAERRSKNVQSRSNPSRSEEERSGELRSGETRSTSQILAAPSHLSRHIFRLDQATPRGVGRGFPKRGGADVDGQVFALRFEPCSEPLCPCVRLAVVATPLDASPGDRSDGFRFHVDLDRCDVVADPDRADGSTDREAFERARRIVAPWDAAVWNDIFQAFYGLREAALRELDLSKVGADVPFPVGEIEGQWWAIGWNEVVPFDRRFAVRGAEHLFVVDDLYCLRTRFPVDDVVLAFVSARELDGLDPSREPFMGPVSVARLDPATGAWLREQEQEGAPLDTLMAAALDLPAFLPTLQRRMRTLRAMYRRRLRAIGFKPEPVKITLHTVVAL